VAMLVFLSRPAWTRIVAADLAYLPDEGRGLRRRSGIRPRSGEGFFVPGVLVLHVLERRRLHLLHLLDLLGISKFSRHERARHFDSGSSSRSSAAYTFSRPGMSHCSSMLSSGTWARKKSVTTPSRSAAIWSETSCDSRMEFLNW